MQGKSGRGERESRNGREKEGKRKERRTERQTRKCSERTLHITLDWSAMATATATEKEAEAASSGGRGSARCTAPMSHAGQGTATRNAAEIVDFVEKRGLGDLPCWLGAQQPPRVARQAHLDTRLVLRACDIGSGGLVHVFASCQDVNIHVLDTEGCRRLAL